MTAIACSELIAEVELIAKNGPPERRTRMLRGLAELFRSAAGRLQADQLRIFDDVLLRLVERSDARALAGISASLAGLEPAPAETMRRLARHEDDAVAGPVLARTRALADDDLVQVICDRSQRHLLAIAGRPSLSEDITSLLLKRAGKEAARALVKNPGARFTDRSLGALLAIAERDEMVAEAAGLRADLPAAHLAELLTRTTDTVRARLVKMAPAPLREKIQAAIAATSAEKPPREANAPADYADALAMVEGLNRIGKLNDSAVNRFAMRRELTNLVASLAVLSGASIGVIEPLMDDERCEGVIIACRAARLNWQTAVSVLNNRRVAKPSKELLEMGKEMFETLYISSAQYTMRFEPPVPAAARSVREVG
ncbi:MAG TPA: DUF2336 domain-containing protein [Bradyrhizobium sp.]|nr:DUF2336 domain-containing protein [Bradyrhizobium sp.]